MGSSTRPQSGLGARTLLTVAREDPAAFTLLWRHAPREEQFATYALELRAMSVRAVRDLMAIASGDALFDEWSAEVVIGWLVEAVLVWLEVGDEAARRRHGQVGHAGPASDARRVGSTRRSRSRRSG